MSISRLFYTVYSEDTEREIYETREEAEKRFKEIESCGDKWITLDISIVKNFYLENGEYNYTDLSDTFESIVNLVILRK